MESDPHQPRANFRTVSPKPPPPEVLGVALVWGACLWQAGGCLRQAGGVVGSCGGLSGRVWGPAARSSGARLLGLQ